MIKKEFIQKINKIKKELNSSLLKKSGFNKFSEFKYFQLADFLPQLIKLLEENQIYYQTSEEVEINENFGFIKYYKLVLTDGESEVIHKKYYNSEPPVKLDKKGNDDYNGYLQDLGRRDTYFRRYLLLQAFDIIEDDGIDNQDNTHQTKKIISKEKELLDRLDKTYLKSLQDEIIKNYGKISPEEIIKKVYDLHLSKEKTKSKNDLESFLEN